MNSINNNNIVEKRVLRERNTKVEVEVPVKEKVIPNIPVEFGTIVEMSSHLEDASQNDRENFPPTAIFDTIKSNVCGKCESHDVAVAIQMGLEEKNKIICDCRVRRLDCSMNPNCKCRLLAVHMAKTCGAEQLIFGKPINPNLEDFFWKKPMFVCSPHCGCRGRCCQNGIQEIDRNQNEKFSIRRTNQKGFCLFTKIDIRKGNPVVSFNGELAGYHGVKRTVDDEQYSLLLFHNDAVVKNVLRAEFPKGMSIEKDYITALKKAYDRMIWINPLRKGNCARFLSHGCHPNLDLGRVFQGGLSPADNRIVFFAKEDIPSGSELTFDYGSKYKDSHLKEDCLCEACVPVSRRSRRPEEAAKDEIKRAKKF